MDNKEHRKLPIIVIRRDKSGSIFLEYYENRQALEINEFHRVTDFNEIDKVCDEFVKRSRKNLDRSIITKSGSVLLKYDDAYVDVKKYESLCEIRGLDKHMPGLYELCNIGIEKSLEKEKIANEKSRKNSKSEFHPLKVTLKRLFPISVAGIIVIATASQLKETSSRNIYDIKNTYNAQNSQTQFEDDPIYAQIATNNGDIATEYPSGALPEQTQPVIEPRTMVGNQQSELSNVTVAACKNKFSDSLYRTVTDSDYSIYIQQYSQYYNIDPNLIIDLIIQESNGVVDITQGDNVGIGQLKQQYWLGESVYSVNEGKNVEISTENILNPEIQIAARTKSLRDALIKYQGNIFMALHDGVGSKNMSDSIELYSQVSGYSKDEIKYNPALYAGFSEYYKQLEKNGSIQSKNNGAYGLAVLSQSKPGTVIATEYDGTTCYWTINEDSISLSQTSLEENISR